MITYTFKGEEYYNLLVNAKEYCDIYNFKIYTNHPNQISDQRY